MRAIEITAPGKIRVFEKDMPKPQEGEALLKVLYGGICGADVASYTGNQPFTTSITRQIPNAGAYILRIQTANGALVGQFVVQ